MTGHPPIGRLSNFRLAGTTRNRDSVWLCDCDCGNQVSVTGAHLRAGTTQSCGCLQKERTSKARRTHGMSGTDVYDIWLGIIRRCENPSRKEFPRYGGRGIRVCAHWKGPNGFANFLADVGPRPSHAHSLDRIDNDGHYEPGNVRWATAKQQARNMRTNRLLTCGGVTKPLAEWAEQQDIGSSTVTRRIDYSGWSVEAALLTPVGG